MAFPSKPKSSIVTPAKALSSRKFADDIAAAVTIGIESARDADTEREYLIQRAPNAVEWIIGPQYLNSPSLLDGIEADGFPERPPFWGSYEFIRDVFELRCPICNRGPRRMVGATKQQLLDEVLLRYESKFDDDVCPKCRTSRREFEADGLLKGYYSAHLVGGMRGGKTFTCGMVISYMEHVLLTIAHRRKDHRGLQEYFGLAPTTQIDMAFVASSLKTTEESMWQAYKGLRANSPWFQRYTPWIKTQEKLQDTPVGMQRWAYAENDSEIHNGGVKLVANAYAAASGTIVGRTRIVGGADEIGRMKDTASSMGADEIYRGVEGSLKSIRSAVENKQLSLRWAGFMLSCSSPTSAHDKSMRLLKDAERVKRMYVMHRSTWEFNPYQPKKNFEDDFLKDPVGAQRDFGADPPLAASPLVQDRVAFEESAIDWDLAPTAEFKMDGWTDDISGRQYVGFKFVDAQLIRNGTPRVIAFDPGLRFDAFAGACAHGELDEDGRIVTVFDWIVRIVPPIGTEVWFEGVYDLIVSLRQFITIATVEFDQWNSAQLIQKIRNLGIAAEESPTKDKHFIQFYRDAMSGRVHMLPPEEEDYDLIEPHRLSAPAAALYEIESLDLDVDGKVSNPQKGDRRGWHCFRGDTPIVRADGTRVFLRDARVGDRILDRTGRIQIVERHWNEGSPGQLVAVSVFGGRTYYVTPNHEWPVWTWSRKCQCGCGGDVKKIGRLYLSGHNGGRGHGNTGVVFRQNRGSAKYSPRIPADYQPLQRRRADEIRRGDFLLMPRKFDPIETDTTPERARLAGYYAAEGWTRDQGAHIQFGFSAAERDTWVADVVSLLKTEGIPTTVHAQKATDGLTIWTRNEHGAVDTVTLREWLRAHVGDGAATKKFSEEIMRWPVKLKIELLRGLFRGDGCQSWYTATAKGSTRHVFTVALGLVSEALCGQVELILAQLGFPSRRTVTRAKKVTHNDLHYVKVGGKWAVELAKLLWGSHSKADDYTPQSDSASSRISPWVDDEFVYLPVVGVSVVPNTESVFNLTVSGDHSYLVSNIATYNSDDVAHVVVHAHRLVQNVGFVEKYDDQSRRAKRVRAEALMTEWEARGAGSVFNPSRMMGGSMRKYTGGGGRGW